MLRRAIVISAAVLAGWLVLLVLLGVALGSRQERMTKERLAESLLAQVALESSDLALIRGRWQLAHLAVRRDDAIGKLSLDVADVRCELGPLGWALVDRDCSELAVSGVRFEVSTMALFKHQRPKGKPVRADRLVIDDAVLVFAPSALVPGMGAIEISIEHAESGPTLLRSPLSWLLTLRELRARLALPGGIAMQLVYERGVLTTSGSMVGEVPVALPVQLPIAGTAADAHEETQQLVTLGRDIAQRLVARRAQDWLEQKLRR
jgi:hypothetical protein